MSARSVLVVGGTGFLGRRISLAFLATGDRVAVLSRGTRPVGSLTAAECICADRHAVDAVRAALGNRTFDVVVDNIAYEPADVTGLLGALRGRVGHYLMISSSAVYADRYVRRPLHESSADLTLRVPVDAPNPFHSRLGHGYANAKRGAEEVLQGSADLAWTVLRPPVILGADDRTRRVWWFVQRLLDGGPIVIPEWGPGRLFQVAWADDVARAVLLASSSPNAHHQAFNVAQAEIYTAETWITACADVLGVTPTWAQVPEAALATHGLPGYALPVAGRPFGHVLLDLSAARCALGFEPQPEDTWLRATLEGCAAHPAEANSAHYDQRELELRAAVACNNSRATQEK